MSEVSEGCVRQDPLWFMFVHVLIIVERTVFLMVLDGLFLCRIGLDLDGLTKMFMDGQTILDRRFLPDGHGRTNKIFLRVHTFEMWEKFF